MPQTSPAIRNTTDRTTDHDKQQLLLIQAAKPLLIVTIGLIVSIGAFKWLRIPNIETELKLHKTSLDNQKSAIEKQGLENEKKTNDLHKQTMKNIESKHNDVMRIEKFDLENSKNGRNFYKEKKDGIEALNAERPLIVEQTEQIVAQKHEDEKKSDLAKYTKKHKEIKKSGTMAVTTIQENHKTFNSIGIKHLRYWEHLLNKYSAIRKEEFRLREEEKKQQPRQ